MKHLELSGLALITSIILLGCAENNNTKANNQSTNFNIDNYPITKTLSQNLKDAIAYMGNEERLAYDIYMNLYKYHASEGTSIKQLQNISTKSEVKHIGIVQSIVQRYDLGEANLTNVDAGVANNTVIFGDMPRGVYDIPAIQDLYDALYTKGTDSAQDALEVGCMVEVTDINDLDQYLTLAEIDNANDVKAAFEILRDGSYNHYWAFDKGLKNLGITTGCCSLGTIEGVNYCHTEYPKNGNGNANGSGNGQGHGDGRGGR